MSLANLLSLIWYVLKKYSTNELEFMKDDLDNYLSLKDKCKKLAENNLKYRKTIRDMRKSHDKTKELVKKYKTVMTRKMEVIVMLKRTDYTDEEIAKRVFCSKSYVRMVRSKYVK